MNTERPEFVTKEHLIYLDDLRESGETNMFGSPRYLRDEFEVNRPTSVAIVKYWMDTFEEDER